MEGFRKERRMFSYWQIVSSCVSNETEAIWSLVYFFVSTLTLLMSAKNAACFLERVIFSSVEHRTGFYLPRPSHMTKKIYSRPWGATTTFSRSGLRKFFWKCSCNRNGKHA